MATFVLIHGGFQGGWCWRKVTPLLLDDGHSVFAPTLTGLGERAHLLSPLVDLSTHVQDVVNVLFYEDLRDVVLVGHSYASMVFAGVAEAVPERLARLVYLDAVIPEDRQAFFDTVPPEVGERWRANSVEVRGTLVYPSSSSHWPLFLKSWQVTDTDDVAWMEPRLTPHPLATMEEPIRLEYSSANAVPSTYILCRQGPEEDAAERDSLKAKAIGRGWDYHEIDSDHEVMITAPRELAALLSAIARG